MAEHQVQKEWMFNCCVQSAAPDSSCEAFAGRVVPLADVPRIDLQHQGKGPAATALPLRLGACGRTRLFIELVTRPLGAFSLALGFAVQRRPGQIDTGQALDHRTGLLDRYFTAEQGAISCTAGEAVPPSSMPST
jgi:hypothetical protein